ncbi:hypothetical protein [Anatilimnocola floriformis]|uniref:hypothetical protein n=1 Tax=Anatilimnocola floriformis TaxID=2948575 RepID=UPI0020C1D467|nr:hypothetical protein [Anatilimnocola floriformis]
MDEGHYWIALEYRLGREFAGLAEGHRRNWWCDGFIPERYLLGDGEPRIEGRAWICDGPKQKKWRFTLFLDKSYEAQADIAWETLLPTEEVTRWLAIDEENKQIQIEPSAGVPDLGSSQ